MGRQLQTQRVEIKLNRKNKCDDQVQTKKNNCEFVETFKDLWRLRAILNFENKCKDDARKRPPPQKNKIPKLLKIKKLNFLDFE